MNTFFRVALLLVCAVVVRAATNEVKWHPGHYVIGWPDQPARALEKHLASPAIRGLKVDYSWRELEPRPGEYDFARLEADLAVAQKHGKQLFLALMDKRWNVGTNPPRSKLPAPDFVLDDPRYGGGVVPLKGGRAQVVTLWQPAVMDRYAALIAALGKRFDGEPNFEGVCTDETALDLETRIPKDVQLATWTRYATELKRAFPRSTVLIYLNWHPLADELAANCVKVGAGFGGPDVVPLTSTNLNPARYPPGKPRRKMEGDRAAEKYWGQVPVGHDAQTPIFGGKEGRPTLDELLAWANDGLHCNYVFWPAITREHFTCDLAKDIIPFLEREQGRIVADRPKRAHSTQGDTP